MPIYDFNYIFGHMHLCCCEGTCLIHLVYIKDIESCEYKISMAFAFTGALFRRDWSGRYRTLPNYYELYPGHYHSEIGNFLDTNYIEVHGNAIAPSLLVSVGITELGRNSST